MVSGFVRSVPKELDEAATIDGAGTFRIFWQIIVPAIKPILGVIALFAFRTAWNEFVTAQVFTMSNPGLKTLSVAVANLRYSANAAAEWHIYDGRRFHRPDPYFDRIPAGEPSVHHRFDSGSGQRIRQRLLLS